MKVTDEMVNRFLRWPLPQSVASDLCVTDRNYKFPRSGTSLLGPDEARDMLTFVLEDCSHEALTVTGHGDRIAPSTEGADHENASSDRSPDGPAIS